MRGCDFFIFLVSLGVPEIRSPGFRFSGFLGVSLGCLWGALGNLGVPLGVPWGVSGVPWGTPWMFLEVPWGPEVAWSHNSIPFLLFIVVLLLLLWSWLWSAWTKIFLESLGVPENLDLCTWSQLLRNH